MKKKFMENKKFRLIAVFLVTVLIVTGFSFAWFYIRQTQANEMSVSNFKVTLNCSFGENKIENPGLITLSTNSEDENYIGNFKVSVDCEGDGAGYLRVKMAHKFYRRGIGKAVQHPADIISYNVNEELWHDNRDSDYCYYYKNALNFEENDQTKSVTLFEGIEENSLNIGSDFEIVVAVEADMVQINRYPQIWGMEKLPWK